jgi:glycosyltransferase involved in cell wall biosynthesis
LKNGTLLYTYVANYYPEKNHEIVLKGWAEFSASVNENVKLVLLGYAPKPELEWKIKALLFDLNISNVLMLSSTNDIPGLLGVVSVGIQGSISEGCPNSTLEYLLYETLPIVSKIDAHKEIFGENYLGYFSVDSSSELAEILKNTLSEDWRNKIREKNIGIINRYSIEKLSESYTNLIN